MPNFVQKAHKIAELAFAEKKRRSGESLLSHCIRVKENLAEIGIQDETMQACALLHPCLSYDSIDIEDITDEFGENVASIISTLTKLSEISLPVDGSLQASSLHSMFKYLAKDMRALIIRLADRIDNIRTVKYLSKKEQVSVAKKALHLYAPIAKAIGLYKYAEILETEGMKILHPKEYKQIQEITELDLTKNKILLQSVQDDIESYLKKQGIHYKISNRIKSPYSTYKKAQSKFAKGDISAKDAYHELKDLLGIRIIVDTVDQCYQVFSFIQQKYDIIHDEYDDYIKNPKPNGYKSLQCPIILNNKLSCEIQIRTFEMHENNEYGVASHFQYKTQASNKSTGWLKEIVQAKDNILKGINAENLDNLFVDEVYVFTEKNDLITLPKGATAIDFAYAIHTDIGNHAYGAKIDGKLGSLRTELTSGQTVKIITAKNKRPSKDWLAFAKTKQAKRAIKSYLQNNK